MVKFKWSEIEQRSIDTIIQKPTNHPILAFAYFSKLFVLNVDASIYCLRAVLYQEQEGIERVISYASRGPPNIQKTLFSS